MGVNRFRRNRSNARDKTRKFTSAQVSSAKQEGRDLPEQVAEDVMYDRDVWCSDSGPDPESLISDLIGVDDRTLYEMGILYDGDDTLPWVDPLPGIEVDPDWDMVSVVSEVDWDVVSLEDGSSDEDES